MCAILKVSMDQQRINGLHSVIHTYVDKLTKGSERVCTEHIIHTHEQTIKYSLTPRAA